MKGLRWQSYVPCFKVISEKILSGKISSEVSLNLALTGCTSDSPVTETLILGVERSLISYLEFLFHEAQGPYSPAFSESAEIISRVFLFSPELRALINLNAAGTLANMVLNRRGRLKFLIADQLELAVVLQWWERSGLSPVSEREVFKAVISKPTISDRIAQNNPGLILRLIDVFPEFSEEFNPDGIRREYLIEQLSSVSLSPLPSERRYRQIYELYMKAGRDIQSIIRDEEKRIVPMQMKRNRFLAYLMKKLHQDTCQICSAKGEISSDRKEVHHIIPLSLNGRDAADNLIVLCSAHHKAVHAGEINLTITADELIHVGSHEEEWDIRRYFC